MAWQAYRKEKCRESVSLPGICVWLMKTCTVLQRLPGEMQTLCTRMQCAHAGALLNFNFAKICAVLGAADGIVKDLCAR